MNAALKRAQDAYNALCETRDAALAALDTIADDATAEDVEALTAAAEAAQADVDRSKPELDRLTAILEARDNTPVLANATTADVVPTATATTGNASSTVDLRWGAQPKGQKAEVTYRPDNGTSFFRDLYFASKKGDRQAQERLNRHAVETRDLTTTATDGGGFVPPIYLGRELWAAAPTAGRPFANAVPNRPLMAKGMAITLPRVTTAPATAIQASENSALNETELVEATLSTPVRTIGGIEDVSVQLLERSDPPIDDVIFMALRDDYDQKLDTQLLSGAGSSGTHTGIRAVSGINTVSYTDASPTAAELVPKVFDAIQKVATVRLRNADTIVMHPRRAAWLASNLSSTFPLFQLGELNQAAGTQDGQGFIGTFAGLRVILDANIATNYSEGGSTNEDEIYVVRASDMFLYEGGVQAEVFRETLSAEATVRFRLYAFSAWVSGRYPSAITQLKGSGLSTPAF